MKKKTIYIFLISLYVTASCGDFLEPRSKSEFVPKDATALNELLIGTAYPVPSMQSLNLFMNVLDDDVQNTPYQDVQSGQNRDTWWAAYSWQPEMYELMQEGNISAGLYNLYKNYYSLILGANAVLDYISTVNDSEELINIVKAQAYTLRGFNYFTLVNIYGSPFYYDKDAPGVPLKLNSGMEETTLERNTVGEVYEQILNDLLEAERLYGLVSEELQWKKNHRVSLPAVQILLSRVYLYMENWSKAAEYAQKVIASNKFQLLDLNNVPITDDANKRIYTNFHSYDSPEAIWLYGGLTDFTYMVNKTGKSNKVYFKASDELMATYDETPGDLRKDRYIVRENVQSFVDGEYIYTPQAFGKIAVHATNYGPGGTSNFARSLRISEAYLNLSEASAMIYKRDGNSSEMTRALNSINTLREYRFAPGTNGVAVNISNSDELIEFIKRERRRELCFEDHRWNDLRRWGMKPLTHIWYPDAESTLEFTLKQNDPGFTMPLPPEALNLNPKLVQNPLVPSPRNN